MGGPAVVRADAMGLRSSRGRLVLLATILGSGMAQLDATVVNVALPRLGRNLHASLTGLQWTVNAYTLTLAGLLLIGGSLGDRVGRRRIFLVGVVWFAAASAICAVAPTIQVLIAARAFQGIGSALLTPGSLAIIQAVFRPGDRAAAVGAWSGLSGVASAIGPVVGGALVGVAPWGWRLVFLINLPMAAAVLVASRRVPETRDPNSAGSLDITGAAAAAVGLALLVQALTVGPETGWGSAEVATLLAGLTALVAFVIVEAKTQHPMMPLGLFHNRQFSGANLVTLVVYAALAGALFLLPVQLQRVSGFSPVAAGSALLPLTAVMMALSPRAGRLATRIGPRWPMTIGPVVAGCGLALFARVGAHSGYLLDVLPAVLVFAVGLSATVAPLTATVLAAAPAHAVGIASAVNNDVARTAGLLAVAVLPGLAGLSPEAYRHPAVFSAGFATAVLIAAGMCAAGGVLSWLTIRDSGVRAG